MQKIITYILAIVTIACNNTIENSNTTPSTNNNSNTFIDTNKNSTVNNDLPYHFHKEKLQSFHNIEMIDYCVLLPLDEYKENFATKLEKAEHVFTPIKNDNNYNQIKVKGFLIDAVNEFNPSLFYTRDVQEVQEDGLGIDSSYIDTIQHFYFIKGYLPNYPDKKYIQLSWVKNDKVTLDITYTAKEEKQWNYRLQQIIQGGINCTAE